MRPVTSPSSSSFEQFVAKKTNEAVAVAISRLQTIQGGADRQGGREIGNAWTRDRFDGTFHLVDPPDRQPAVTLVFVQSRDGNTVSEDPAALGGGPTDKHLIYEGLSRVAADAVLAGAATATDAKAFFSVWHPQIVALRQELQLPRHPAQIVISNRGEINIEALLFNVPDVAVYLIAGNEAQRRWARALEERPWITVVALNEGLVSALRRLRDEHGLSRIQAIGGRSTASALIDAGLVQDICLTTTSRKAGQPGTPFYAGSQQLRFESLVTKISIGEGAPIRFEHFAVQSH